MLIRGLIFDYGGVIWDMRWDAALALEQEYGIPERQILHTLYGGDAWREVERGRGDREAWRRDAHAALEELAGRPLPPLHDHWRDQQHYITPNLDLIRRLRPPYRTSILSNADSTLTQRLQLAPDVWTLFDDVLCSADVGMAKPEPAIYALAAQRLGLPPAECVFIDDLPRNIDAAQEVGMAAVLFRVGQDDLAEQLRALGVQAASP
jgi:epoxide hydrolase-like predicted phosphatase